VLATDAELPIEMEEGRAKKGREVNKEIYELIGETEESDPATDNKLQDLAHSVDKNLWQLRAHVQKPSSRRGELPWFRYQGADPSNH
jgi:hypothetical protein